MSRSRAVRLAGVLGAAAVLSTVFAMAASGPRFRGRPLPVPMREGDVPKFEGTPPRHVGAYPAFNLVWEVDRNLKDIRAIYPHPVIGRRVVAVTAAGLMMSDDSARSWKPVAGAGVDAIGRVRHVEFSFTQPDTFYLGGEKGIWRAEGGKAPVRIGSKEAGMADDNVAQVRLDGSDPLFQTLVAVHGPDAAGMSLSEDGGRTWRTLANLREHFIDELLPGGPGAAWALILARAKDPSKPRGIYFCRTLGDYPREFVGDVDVNEGVVELLCGYSERETGDATYWAGGAGILRLSRDGMGISRLGPDDAKWTGVGMTYGATADERILFGYQPGGLGMGASSDGGKTFAAISKGLPTGRFVKEGARIRAAAGGACFYAAINNTLYIGRRSTGPFAITEASAAPLVMSGAPAAYARTLARFRRELTAFRGQRFGPSTPRAVIDIYQTLGRTVSDTMLCVTARIVREGGSDPSPATAAAVHSPARVTVDLSRVGGSARAPMFDDGLHNDGAPDDGVYGAVCLFRPDRLQTTSEDRRRPWPGAMGLTITAVSEDGKLSSAVAVMNLLVRRESHIYWTPPESEKWRDADGGLVVTREDYDGPAFADDIVVPSDQRKCVRWITADKPWSIPFSSPYARGSMGYESISFFIRTDGPALRDGDGDLFVQLADYSPDTVAASTVRVPVLKEKLVEGGTIDNEYRRVVVPMALLRAAPATDGAGSAVFRPALLKSVVLSGDGKAAAKQAFEMSAIRFQVSDSAAAAQEGRP